MAAKKCITVRNPQANAIVERIHQVIVNMIKTFGLQTKFLDQDDPWKGILSATAFAVISMYHTTLKKAIGKLMFGRDMIFNIKHVASWEYIRQNKQKMIEKNNRAENAKRVAYSYKKGDPEILPRGTENKYEALYQGPYKIIKVNDNETVCLKIGAVEEVINLRRLTPYIPANAPDHRGECSMPLIRKGKRTRIVP